MSGEPWSPIDEDGQRYLVEKMDRELNEAGLSAMRKEGTLAGIELAAARNERDDARSELASATDLANTWAREDGVREARNEHDLKGVIDRIWDRASGKRSELEQKLAELAVALEKRQKCHRCKGVGKIAQRRNITSYETDSPAEEDLNWYWGACPECGGTPQDILAAHDRELVTSLVQVLTQARTSLAEHRCGTGSCHCCRSIAAIDAAFAPYKQDEADAPKD